mmetsp:Transcript_119653/g.338747  ORF Transcript_119653/g.338747 Transcript_119653/m.338747 type:complete len:125 (+) Transcript_119653:117-491(+)
MATEEELQRVKEHGCPCVALFCAECQCNCCEPPFVLVAGKVCCCNGSVQLGCPLCECGAAPCYSPERGCVELVAKLCCIYAEIQFPPSCRDIGCGICGCRCCVAASARELEAPLEGRPTQEEMS